MSGSEQVVSNPMIEVEIEFSAGSTINTVLDAQSDILQDLYLALGSAGRADVYYPPFLVQVPVDGGRTAHSFMSNAVVGLKTTPPVLIENTEPLPAETGPSTLETQEELAVRIDDFLTPEENRQLMDFTLEHADEFVASDVSGDEKEHRSSKVLFKIGSSKWNDVFQRRLKIHLPHLFAMLRFRPFEVGKFEIQLTASNDGDYFKMHSDHAAEYEGPSGRKITYVYYFHTQPKRYSGGGLLLHRNWPNPDDYQSLQGITRIEPQNNSLVAFVSSRPHELEMVRCPTGDFSDSRFTVNGWLHERIVG